MTLQVLAAGVNNIGQVAQAKSLSPDDAAPGWTALLIVLALGVAVWFLWRSMNAHLRKVPSDFDEPGAETAGEPEDEPDPIDREQ